MSDRVVVGEVVPTLTASVFGCGGSEGMKILAPDATSVLYRNGGDATTSIVGDAEIAHTLTSMPLGVMLPAPVAFRGRDGGSAAELGEHEVSNTLRASMGGSTQASVLTTALRVRRLMPVECERLMGWPDDHTRWDADGNEIADSHRYAMCGNGVVAPQAEWIGRRLIQAIEASR